VSYKTNRSYFVLLVEGDHMNGHHHHAYNNNKMPPPPPLSEDATGIREVWNHNLREEFRNIRALLKSKYTYIAMVNDYLTNWRGVFIVCGLKC